MRALNIDDVTSWFGKSKEGRAIVAAQEKAEVTERQRHKDAIAEAVQACKQDLPALLEAEQTAAVAHADAVKRLAELQAAYASAAAAVMHRRLDRNTAVRRLEVLLETSASPAIFEFWGELRQLEQRARGLQIVTEDERVSYVSGRRLEVVGSNLPNIRAHMALLRASADEVLSWRLEPLTDAELDARIVAMRTRIQTSLASTSRTELRKTA